jgi:hypothetical protein
LLNSPIVAECGFDPFPVEYLLTLAKSSLPYPRSTPIVLPS